MKNLKTEKEISDEKMEKVMEKLEDRIVKSESLEKDKECQINEMKDTLNDCKNSMKHEERNITELNNLIKEKKILAKTNFKK